MRIATLAVVVGLALVPLGAAAPAPKLDDLQDDVLGAISAEKNALDELDAEPRRVEDALEELARAQKYLRRAIGRAKGLSLVQFVPPLEDALALDGTAVSRLGSVLESRDAGRSVRDALELKQEVRYGVREIFRGQKDEDAPQCADGRDNDGDRLVDAVGDTGCTSRADGTERSPFTCDLDVTSTSVGGSCSGPFGAVEIRLPAGASFDTDRAPATRGAHACEFETDRRLECTVAGVYTNPGHVVRVGWRTEKPGPYRPEVTFRDAAGRVVRWSPSDEPAQGGSSADLRVDVSGPSEVTIPDGAPSHVVRYAVEIRNAGPSEIPPGAVAEVRVSGAGLAAGHRLRPDQAVARCTGGTCTLRGLDRGRSASFTVEVPVASPTTIRVTVELKGLRVRDPVLLSNTDSVTTQVTAPAPEISLGVLAPTTGFINPNGEARVRITLNVTNRGTGALQDGASIVIAPAPGVVTSINASDRLVTCDATTVWTCPLHRISPAQTVHWDVFVSTRSRGTLQVGFSLRAGRVTAPPATATIEIQ